MKLKLIMVQGGDVSSKKKKTLSTIARKKKELPYSATRRRGRIRIDCAYQLSLNSLELVIKPS